MGKQDFDNILKLLRVDNTLSAGSVVSVEMDFNLPRGFIAKIREIKMSINNWSEDLEGLVAVENNAQVQGALVRDPDDTTTIQTPANDSQHDVLFEHKADIWAELGVAEVSNVMKSITFPEEIDVISARNLRFNTVGQGADVAILTETVQRCEVFYTLEKVTDATILDLLDIL